MCSASLVVPEDSLSTGDTSRTLRQECLHDMTAELVLTRPFRACVNHDPPVPKSPACMDEQLSARLGAGSVFSNSHYSL